VYAEHIKTLWKCKDIINIQSTNANATNRSSKTASTVGRKCTSLLYLIQNYKRRASKRIKDVLHEKGIKKATKRDIIYLRLILWVTKLYQQTKQKWKIRECNEEDTTRTIRSLWMKDEELWSKEIKRRIHDRLGYAMSFSECFGNGLKTYVLSHYYNGCWKITRYLLQLNFRSFQNGSPFFAICELSFFSRNVLPVRKITVINLHMHSTFGAGMDIIILS
jgi:hypothetical protein